MVSLCVMGWGLVLLENSSAAVAVAAAVTAAAVAAAAVAVGGGPQKSRCFYYKYRIWTLFTGAFSETTLYTISRFLSISKRR